MSRTITALFDTRADAEAGQARLIAANVDADNVRIHQGDSASLADTTTRTDMSTSATTTGYGQSGDQDTGIWSSIKKAFLPDEDRAAYEEGMRRGGYVLSADVDEDEVDRAVAALEDANSVDIDERSNAWRAEGWTAPTAAAGMSRPAMFGADGIDRDTTRTGDEEVIPVIEEQMVVGKREVERGGVRVRSYVTETPVHEQIRLRQERVQVERRPVDRAISDVDTDAFRERTVSMTETSEEAVVGKTAHVVEEVVVSKNVDERVEEVNDTVRRTDVDVENIGTTGTAGTARTAGDTGSGLLDDVKDGLANLTGQNDPSRPSGKTGY